MACKASASNECDVEDRSEHARCLVELNKRLDGELNAAYKLALATRPEQDQTDIRRNKEQLRKSQRAWLKFKDDNCNLMGGLQGGNNYWVSEFAMQCDLVETAERTKFLRRVANGEFSG